MSTHQLDQAVFRPILPEDIAWEPFPAFPASARLAVVVGDPAVIVLPGGTPHFHWAKSGAYVTQVTALGPISLEYLDPQDDPRNR
jgi:hypothetical protein